MFIVTIASANAPTFGTISTNPSGILPIVSKYEKFEITFTTSTSVAGNANPYDPMQFDYYAEFWSPTDKYFKVNAFYFNLVHPVPDHDGNICQPNTYPWYKYEVLSESSV